jgi:hypothetical protein
MQLNGAAVDLNAPLCTQKGLSIISFDRLDGTEHFTLKCLLFTAFYASLDKQRAICNTFDLMARLLISMH